MAVIGVGRIGLAHAANLEDRVKGARLIAVSTSNHDRAARVQRSSGDLRVYSTPEELLEKEAEL